MLQPNFKPSDCVLSSTCLHCEGKGFIELRDCSGEVQREETCTFCNGIGKIPNKGEDATEQFYPD